MTTVFDVPAELLINTVADEFKDNNDKIVAPEWTKLVKTGVHKKTEELTLKNSEKVVALL